jgi:flavin reductase (DIM6/NTAB) family NADH-FMN oxidoreductase RutF
MIYNKSSLEVFLKERKNMKYICSVCGYVYDEEKEGKKFSELPEDWKCPKCGSPKSKFAPAPDIDLTALFSITYGLYVISTKDGEKDNGCIINTLSQVTATPLRIEATLQKQDYTYELIKKSKVFNVSALSTEVPFDVFKRFGYQSGRTADKFGDFAPKARSANGVYYLTDYALSFISAKVVKTVDLGTHVMFIGEVTEARNLAKKEPCTYSYYQRNIKPKPQMPAGSGTGAKWVCRICGYVYDDSKEKIKFEDLPSTWTCPLCHHPKSDFDKMK